MTNEGGFLRGRTFRLILLAVAATATGLAACSGSIPGSTPAANAAAPDLLMRSAGPYAGSAHVRNGEQLNYVILVKGTQYTWSGPAASPVPSPYTGSAQSLVKYGYDPATHVYSTTLTESGYSQTTYFGYSPVAGGMQETLYSYRYTQIPASGSTYYPAGRIAALLPLQKGAGWNDAAPLVETSQDDLVTTAATIAQDGSYRYHAYGIIEKPIVVTGEVASDATASYSSQQPGQTATGWTIGEPEQRGTAWVIAGTTTAPRNFPATPPPAQPFHLIDWYPGDHAPRPLLTDATTVTGSVTTPKTCAAQSGIAAVETVERSTVLDPLAMYQESIEQENYYGKGGYAVCEIVSKTRTNYILFAPNPADDGYAAFRDVETDTWVLHGFLDRAVPEPLAALPFHPLDAGIAILHFRRSH